MSFQRILEPKQISPSLLIKSIKTPIYTKGNGLCGVERLSRQLLKKMPPHRSRSTRDLWDGGDNLMKPILLREGSWSFMINIWIPTSSVAGKRSLWQVKF